MKVPVPVKPVEDMDALVGESLAEFRAQHLVGGSQDEVDDLNGRVDDAEFVDGALKRCGEELVVQLDNDPLPTLGGVDVPHAHADRLVELLQLGVRGMRPS